MMPPSMTHSQKIAGFWVNSIGRNVNAPNASPTARTVRATKKKATARASKIPA